MENLTRKMIQETKQEQGKMNKKKSLYLNPVMISQRVSLTLFLVKLLRGAKGKYSCFINNCNNICLVTIIFAVVTSLVLK